MLHPQLNRYEIERYIAATAARADLEVVWHNDPKIPPATDGKKIFLRTLAADASQEDAEMLISSAIHETEHVKHTDFSTLKKFASANPSHSVLGGINNCLEDDNIDYKNAQEFVGDRQIRSKVTAKLISGIVDGVKHLYSKGEPVPKNTEITLATMAWEATNTTDYYRDTAGMGQQLYDSASPQVKEWVDKLRAGDYREKLLELRDSPDEGRSMKVFKLAQRIFKEVFGEDPEKEEQESQQRQKQAQAEGGEGKEGDKEGKGKSKGGKGKLGEGEGESAKGSYSMDYKTFLVDQENRSDPKNSESSLHINYEDRDYDGNYVPTPWKDTLVINYVTGKSNYPRINAVANSISSSRYRFKGLESKPVDGFANKVRRLLQIRSKGRWEYGTKKGSLHTANLYRVGMKDAEGYNQRVFKRHIISDVLDTAVMVLVDDSGSMGGSKIVHATEAAMHISHTLGNTLHIPIEIAGFTELGCKNTMFLYRAFTCKHLSNDKIVARMSHAANYMDQNADADAILWGHSRLAQRKEKRKLMIVLSDGSPASSKAGDCMGYTKRIVKAIEETSPIDIVAIGIEDTNVKKIYKQHYVIQQSSELEKAMLTIIERKVI
jgi:hypothetical protein